jgi:hypothetical protein
MCNEYTESVLHPSDNKSQIVKNTIEKQYGKKQSSDCYSYYSGKRTTHNRNNQINFFRSDSCCQTYEQQWQTTIQNGQINLSRVQIPDESSRRHNNNTNGTLTKKETNSTSVDHNIHAKVELQLDMLDCNYEQDKREYYAQLIGDYKKTTPIHDLDKELKHQVRYKYRS